MSALRLRALVGVALLLAAALPAPAQTKKALSEAASAVRSFYQYHFSNDHAFTPAAVAARRKWLDSELSWLLERELERADEHARKNPDEAPYFEGDPFTDSQTFPSSFAVGEPTSDAGAVRVPVVFTWTADSDRGKDERAVTVVAGERSGRWVILDVVSSNGESLRKVLERPSYMP